MVLSQKKERLQDALERILGLKVTVWPSQSPKKMDLFLREREDLKVVGCDDHIERAKQAADKGITVSKKYA